MTDIDTPHFAFPFAFDAVSARPVIREQRSIEEIEDCLEVLLSTELGERIEEPDYGIPSPVFRQQGSSNEEIASAIARWEPRLPVDVDTTEFQDMVETIRVRIGSEGQD